MLEVAGVTKHFNGVHALNGVDLTIARGGITGIIGPNGAGKTTLFNCISGIAPASSGQIRFDGRPIERLRPDEISNLGLLRTFQLARGFPRLTVLESLLLYGRQQPGEHLMTAMFSRATSRARERQLLDKATEVAARLRLTHILDKKSAEISGGQKKLLEIGRALMTDPKLLLLDEPMAGVNPSLIRDIGDRLIDIAADGLTIVLIEHQMDLIARLCSHVVVMAEGRHLTEGSFEAVTGHAAVQAAYMGRRA